MKIVPPPCRTDPDPLQDRARTFPFSTQEPGGTATTRLPSH